MAVREFDDRGGAGGIVLVLQPADPIFIALAGSCALHVEEAHLLGLGGGDRRALAQRIEIKSPSRSRVPLSVPAFRGAGGDRRSGR